MRSRCLPRGTCAASRRLRKTGISRFTLDLGGVSIDSDLSKGDGIVGEEGRPAAGGLDSGGGGESRHPASGVSGYN